MKNIFQGEKNQDSRSCNLVARFSLLQGREGEKPGNEVGI